MAADGAALGVQLNHLAELPVVVVVVVVVVVGR